MKKLTVIIFLLFLFVEVRSETTNVYDYDYAFGLGLTTNKLLFDNLGTKSIRPVDDAKYGGSFNGAMPGIDARLLIQLDEMGDWRLPIGANYIFMSAVEKYPVTTATDIIRFEHSVNQFSFYTGINYTLFRFPLANALMYIGVDVKANYIHLHEFLASRSNQEELVSSNTYTKDAALRLGGLLKMGIEGELDQNYMINASWGFDALNLIGRNNQRGQLLTPLENNSLEGIEGEDTEEMAFSFYFSLMIQYRF